MGVSIGTWFYISHLLLIYVNQLANDTPMLYWHVTEALLAIFCCLDRSINGFFFRSQLFPFLFQNLKKITDTFLIFGKLKNEGRLPDVNGKTHDTIVQIEY